MKRPTYMAAVVAAATAVFVGSASLGHALPHDAAKPAPRAALKLTPGAYVKLATRSIQLLETRFYNGTGLWHMCVPVICNTKNRDWGADALTNVLYLRWKLEHDRSVLPLLTRLAQTSHLYLLSQPGSSDTAMWDAVAEMRVYDATGSRLALTKAETAFIWLTASTSARGFASGACPQIDYQWAQRSRGDLKTLETGSNYVKAAVLLYKATHRRAYLTAAETGYALARRYFLTPSSQLYTTYIWDNGVTCRQLPGRYYASVNGNMIWAGTELAALTGNQAYLRQAIATASAVRTRLSDSTGVYANLQADNDIAEPLIEGMYALATIGHHRLARTWLLTNASAAGADVNQAGEFGRFFDGTATAGLATAWQINGGIALMQVAAALDPSGSPADPGFWSHAVYVRDVLNLTGPSVRITFTGRAIAIIGTIGAICCSNGHARVLVDGVPTFDQTGIWQNKTSPARHQPGQVLFAWRWRTTGRHTITVERGIYDAIEGGSYFSMNGYLLVK